MTANNISVLPKMIFLLICILININISAQNKIDGYFINPKFGIYNWLENDAGGLLTVEAGIIKDKHIFMTSYSRGEQIYGPQILNTIDFNYGKFIGERLFRFQYQAGLGVIWGDSRSDYSDDKSDFFTVGIPLKLGFKILPIKYLSLGIDIQANLNLENSMYMPMISLEFGKLR